MLDGVRKMAKKGYGKNGAYTVNNGSYTWLIVG